MSLLIHSNMYHYVLCVRDAAALIAEADLPIKVCKKINPQTKKQKQIISWVVCTFIPFV